MGERDYETIIKELSNTREKLNYARRVRASWDKTIEEREARVQALEEEALSLLHAELEALGERQSDFGGPRS